MSTDKFMQTLPPLLEKRPADWWSRNWKWFVPVLCFAGILGISGFVALILGFLKSSDAYSGALARAKTSPAVIAALGTPIQAGFFVTGNISVNGSSGKADLAIPITGPNAKATIYVVAAKEVGVWSFHRLVVQIEPGGERITLPPEPSSQTPGPTPDGRGSP
jgi:hypothetical protein